MKYIYLLLAVVVAAILLAIMWPKKAVAPAKTETTKNDDQAPNKETGSPKEPSAPVSPPRFPDDNYSYA